MPAATEIQIRHVEVPTPDGVADSHLAVPNESGKYPGVLFFMDAFGVRPVIDEWVQRIAAEGYVVLAPNLLYRSQRSPIVEDVKAATSEENRPKLFQSLMPMMKQLTPDACVRDGNAYIDFLSNLPESNGGPIGITGYCMGARMALRVGAARPDKVAAIAGFHGGNLATEDPDSPHRGADKIKAEVYMGYADHDESASPEQQLRLEEAFDAAGVRHHSEVYIDAPHGYTMSDTAAYREDAAEQHFRHLIALLKRTLK
jgi:carboxymethylenebutenolidase